MKRIRVVEETPEIERKLQRIRRWILGTTIVLACVLPTGLFLRSRSIGDALRSDLHFWYVWIVGYLFAALLGACILFAVHWAEAKGWFR